MISFIVNGHSRSGKGDSIWDTLYRKIKASGLAHRVLMTEHPGHATELAQSIYDTQEDRPEAVVIVGGDGSINEVINGLPLEAEPIVGYVPSGSGNDFARGLGLKGSPEERLDVVLGARKLRTLDLGQVSCGESARRFAVSGGIGYDAAVCRAIENSRIKDFFNRLHMGQIVYTLIGVKMAATYKKVTGRLVVDDDRVIELKQLAFVSCHNLTYEGGGWPFAPEAQPDDGYLDLCVVDPPSRLIFALGLICSKLGGRHTRFKGIQTIRCRKAALHLDAELPVHTDGEVLGDFTDLEFQILPSSLRLME